MITEPTLFDTAGLARVTDPETSQLAAAQITGRTELEILGVFNAQPGVDGLTADELCDWLPSRNAPTVKSALSRVQKAKLVHDSGQRRLSRCGCKQVVWILGSPAAPEAPVPEQETH